MNEMRSIPSEQTYKRLLRRLSAAAHVERQMSRPACTMALVLALSPGVCHSQGPRLSANGFGPVRLGMSVEQAVGNLGTPLQKVEDTNQNERYVVVPVRRYVGISFTVSGEGTIDGIYIAHDTPSFKTDRDLHVGSSANDVWRKHGGQAEVKAYQCGSAFLIYTYRSPTNPGMGVVYTVSESGLVEGIMAGDLRHVTPPC